VSRGPAKGSTGRGLAFLVLLSFVTSFLVARAFATLNPDVVVISGGIHFHHFWYGLAMIVTAAWLGIVYDNPKYRRFYAVLLGLGGGLVGDEVGLLLTFGDYDSDLTFFFFVIAVSVGVLGILLLGRRDRIEYDVLSLRNGERTVYIGVVVVGLSALGFAGDYLVFGVVTVAVGLLVVAAGLLWHRREGVPTPVSPG
jgi:hypothetical protein